MATSDSNDRPKRQFLPSIRNPVFKRSDGRQAALTPPQKKDSENRICGGGASTHKGIRSFFSSVRSSRTSANDKTQPKENCLSSHSSKSPFPLLSTSQHHPRNEEGLTINDSPRRRTSSLRDSKEKKELLSVESNLRCITSAPPAASSRGSSPWLEGEDGDSLGECSTSSVTKVGPSKFGQRNSGAEPPLLVSVETNQVFGDLPNELQIGNSLSSGSVLMEKEEEMIMYTNSFDLKNGFKKARRSKNYSSLVKFLTTAFSSFSTLSKVFKPSDHRKTILKSIINCLLGNIKKKQDDEDLAGYLILLLNPQFDSCSSYVIFSHLLRQVSSLSDRQHQIIVEWMEWLPISSFKALVNRLKEFVGTSLFPSAENELPSSEKMRFWVPSAVKVLALLNAANWLNNKPVVSYTYMYIDVLDNMNLAEEYDNWQSRSGTFSFCQYPFLLSLAAKRYILQKDSETQMIEVARRSLMQGVKKRKTPAVNMLFLNLKVRRHHLIADSLNEISRKRNDLKKKLKVTFVGEPGVDMGGLTKEWFMLLVRKVFRPEYGMFRFDSKSSCYWFTNMAVNDLSEFNLVGVLMGLAVYNSTILDIRFPLCCYKKLLNPAVIPADPNAIVGVTKLGLSDLEEVMPELARGLQELLSYEGNVEEDMCQAFQVSNTVCGSVITENLKENGNSIAVTNDNRTEYVNLYVDYILNRSMYRQFAAFYHGFHSVCASNALIMLRPEEVEMLVCGNPDFDMRALSKVTAYDGFSKKDSTIRYFWEIVGNFSRSLKRKLLRFCTGSDRIPIGGMAEMDFKITRMADASEEMLPMAHTCFNQLCLPPYKTRQKLKSKLIIAISNSEGFGIE